MSIVAATIDSREPKWVQALTFGGVPTTVAALDYGDLIAVTDDGVIIGVERKTAGDLLTSVADGRLFQQAAGLRQQTPWAYLVVTGMLYCRAGNVCTDTGETGWSWASVQGALLSVQELGCQIVYAEDDGEYEATVVRLSSRSHGDTVTLKPLKAPELVSDGERVLSALPGVGLERAGSILDYCGSAAWGLVMTTHHERHGDHIPGIGPGTRAKIREALGMKENEELTVVMNGEDE